MNKIFVTSDTHFSHRNICGPSLTNWDKGFRNFSSLEEMNEVLINNLNEAVAEDDVLYHLGDFAMGMRKLIPGLRARINCQTIHLILGNHDDTLDKRNKKYSPEHRALFSSVERAEEFRHKGQLICMFHYPLGSWNEIGCGAIQLFGHCHGSYDRVVGRQLDVGVDGNDFKPWLLDDIVQKMLAVEPASVDHHNSETSYG